MRRGEGEGLPVVETKGHNLLVSGYEWLQQIDQEGFPLSMKTYEISLNATPAILPKNLIGAINQGGTDLVLTNHSDLALFLDPVHSNSSIPILVPLAPSFILKNLEFLCSSACFSVGLV